jgi:L-amino acid N-acyltransferase YncA
MPGEGEARPARGVEKGPPLIRIEDLLDEDRASVIPILKESFVGVYRWHAKKTLGTVSRIRVAREEGALVGAALLERLAPEVGYVYYLFVGAAHRREGIGGALLDDAVDGFRAAGAHVIYAAAEDDNVGSLRLFRSRGFRTVERKEVGYLEGGLGAWGLRSRMYLVGGEVLLGLRVAAGATSAVQPKRPLT